jgi:peptidoglycan/xylan/chitin deacetylase (PgdA/CDA1 family)
MKNFTPYNSRPSEATLRDIIYNQNYGNFIQTEQKLKSGPDAPGYVANRLAMYRDFLTALLVAGYSFSPVEQAIATGRQSFRNGAAPAQAMIRHDVDGDLPAALACAEVERRLGIRATYYLLHTGPYYGTFANGVFLRNEACAEAYAMLQDMGHEVGLHTDSLWVYQQWGVDGAQCIRDELCWLRSIGLRIVGTAPHNSPSVYGGVSNNEIFGGYDYYEWHVFDGRVRPHPRPEMLAGIPLGSLDPAELDLTYQADAVWDLGIAVDWMSIMGADTVQRYTWFDTKNHETLSFSKVAERLITEKASFKRLIYCSHAACLADLIANAPHLLYLSVHPEFYGRRDAGVLWPC